MRNWFVFFLWIALATGVVFAQEQPPFGAVGTLEAGDFRSLAVTADGSRLLVADAENRQVRIYEFSDPTNPALLSTLDVSGTPVLLAGGEHYGLVAVTSDEDTDTIEVVAPALPGTPYSSGFNYIDIPKNPLALTLSPDQRWGVAVSEHGYMLLGINAPDDIDQFPVDETIIDAALSDTTAYFLRDGVLETAPLGALEALQAARVLELDGAPSRVRLNTTTTEGVVVLDGSQLIFFDPTSLEQTGAFSVTGNPIADVQFLSSGAVEYLLVTQAETNTIAVLDATDPQNVRTLPGTPALDNPVRALTIHNQYLIVTDGATVHIFST